MTRLGLTIPDNLRNILALWSVNAKLLTPELEAIIGVEIIVDAFSIIV